MSSTSDDMPRGTCWKERHVSLRAAGWRDTVVCPVQHDGRHRNRRPGRQATLDLVKARVAWGIAVAVAVGMDDHGYEIRIVEGCGRTVIGGVIEVPGRRPLLPEQLADPMTLLLEALTAPLGVEIPLVP